MTKRRKRGCMRKKPKVGKVIVIGAGPAGLTAAHELLRDGSGEFEVVILEETKTVGGISRTVNYRGNRMDMGGHRFFSKVGLVNDWWRERLGKDFVKRKRLSRILFEGKFFDYPISLSMRTLKTMGFLTTVQVGVSYLRSVVKRRPEKTLEDFYVNRFGRKLYEMFFENYTENLWGRHPSEIDPEWGAQRAKGLSVGAILRDMGAKLVKKEGRKVETSLIEEFWYPKLGPGQMWEKVLEEVKEMGGEIVMEAKVVEVRREKNRVTGVGYEKDGKKVFVSGDVVISSMAMRDLVEAMNDVPKECVRIAKGLPYRDYMTVGVLFKKEALAKKLEDNWIYVHDTRVKLGRLQIYNNWSQGLVKEPKKTVWMGLEYFCDEGDELWKMRDEDFARMATSELRMTGLLKDGAEALDWHVERVKKAYPAYFDTYEEIGKLRKYLDKTENLFLVGRNGQHRYNNMDHSMCTAFEAVKNIKANVLRKDNVWAVNTEKEYHEAGGV